MITIKNLLTILIKLIGLIFIVISCVYVIPGYILYWEDNFFEDDQLKNFDIPINIVLAFGDIFINLLIYYFFIYKTELITKFLHINNHLEKEVIETNSITVNKFAQIGVVIASILIFVFSFPEVVNNIVMFYMVKEEYSLIQNIEFIHNLILSLSSILLLAFNDKISKFITK